MPKYLAALGSLLVILQSVPVTDAATISVL